MKEEEELDVFIKSSRFFKNTQEFEENLHVFFKTRKSLRKICEIFILAL